MCVNVSGGQFEDIGSEYYAMPGDHDKRGAVPFSHRGERPAGRFRNIQTTITDKGNSQMINNLPEHILNLR